MAKGESSYLGLSTGVWLGVAGVVIGLPGFLGAFLSDNPSQLGFAAAAGVVGLCFIAGAWYVDHATGAAPYTMRSVRATLTLHDTAGTSATLAKEYKIVPNYKHLKEITFRNISADGAVSDLCWNDVPVPAGQIEKRAHELVVRVRFNPPLAKWRETQGTLSYTISNSFPGATEWFAYSVDFPTKKVDLAVNLSAGRPCRAARSSLIHGEEVAFNDPEIDATRLQLKLALRRPKIGDEYVIYWDW